MDTVIHLLHIFIVPSLTTGVLTYLGIKIIDWIESRR